MKHTLELIALALSFATIQIGQAAPEIGVAGNWGFIPDGSAAFVSSNGTDMGNAYVNGSANNGSAYVKIQVFNTGDTDLLLDDIHPITFTGGEAADFHIATSNEYQKIIPPGDWSQFTIVCDPSATGARTTTFHIHSNDSNEADFDFAITCNGLNGTPPDRPNLTWFTPDPPKVKVKTNGAGTKYKITGSFTLYNSSLGEDIATPFHVLFAFSGNRYAEPTVDTFSKPKKLKKMKSGASKIYKYKFTVTSLAGNSTIIAIVDGLNNVSEFEENDNVQGALVPVQ